MSILEPLEFPVIGTALAENNEPGVLALDYLKKKKKRLPNMALMSLWWWTYTWEAVQYSTMNLKEYVSYFNITKSLGGDTNRL